MSDTQNRVALVTGASRGIGYAIADKLAADGFSLAICGTRDETIRQAADKLAAAHGVEVLPAVVNVADRDAIQGFVADVVKHFGRLDVLVNNAGITRDNLSMRMKAEEWQEVLDTNLGSVFHASQAAIRPMMKGRFGRIINISSVVASMGNPGQMNYCASKGGVDAMTRSLAREIGSRGITVNAIAPGFIATDMTAELGDDAHAKLSEQIPLGRLGSAEDIAHAVAFLAGDGAAYITGQVLHVNGGMYM
ncbi:MAG: 3-oxoacyl-ACP reductase [Zetaproteobacteria bacterium CG12_big_fil_rev_8_21_14_0_65_55_1124]|nr:MAG: 3-oxoacyl-[acyl-carrier-protein] reductase [Zetaproteobacteria bacterium CG1_02_55_237]PIS19865.1 MAG: 3-oxoacyl-ACP reductase [Zetaproteobacteria bacterium CG08_land_8_20_14_0_20_55_17]PIW42529.1 MAG: 3-oxoacyl-ACP reductase [Zetaproteobacteria bacterium CG12_big_fil_rev_8_21_14_0_65_55_1124]PIY51322.1 MAG: 3-oxoacyl-ACP reductase [Zetaproteobacteria bacterium CG_4_10_14_0_8_um_filter_55_43]PIZ36677.1 MAG: 3-oxoacyl-ACP reductase [Zetaproteobacteria bacterium CG_4_10_14_0_2_um_filter_5